MDTKRSDVLQGTLDLMILKTLHALGPLHGFGIARRIEQVSRDVLQLNAMGKQLIVDHGPTMIQVRRENEIAPLFMIEVDLTKGRLRSCPLPPGQFGIPRIVEFQMRVGVSETDIMVQEYPNGTVVRFAPEQVSHGLLDSALSLNATRSMKCA